MRVLYPSQHFADLDAHVNVEPDGSGIEIPSARYLFTSINRYERKKDLSLAVRSLGMLSHLMNFTLCRVRDIYFLAGAPSDITLSTFAQFWTSLVIKT